MHRRDLRLADLESLVAGDHERLGLGVPRLADKRSSEQAHLAKPTPVVRGCFLANRQALAEQGLGRWPLPLQEQVAAEAGLVAGQARAVEALLLTAACQVIAPDHLGVGPAAEQLVSRGEVVAAKERVGVVSPELGLERLDIHLEKRGRLGVTVGLLVGEGEVVAADERAAVISPEPRRARLDVRLGERGGRDVTAGEQVSDGEVVEAVERIGVIYPELRLPNLEGRLVQRGRLGVTAGAPVSEGELVAASERIGVVRAELRLFRLQCRLEQRDRLGVTAG